MVMLYMRHRQHSMEMLKIEEGLPYAAYLICIYYAFRVDLTALSPAQSVKLSQSLNISTTLMRRKENFIDTIKIFLRYLRSFEEYYGVYFVDMIIMRVVGNRMSLRSLDASSRATCIPYSRAGKMTIEKWRAVFSCSSGRKPASG